MSDRNGDVERQFAVELNNLVWDHLDTGDVDAYRDASAGEDVLYAAYASAHHWRAVGTTVNRARAEHLIARAACLAGYPSQALHHARRCVELVEAAGDDAEDWDHGFALEALARAEAASGDLVAARTTYARASEAADRIAEASNRDLVVGELERAPWFGLR